jgi:hypothetical protein
LGTSIDYSAVSHQTIHQRVNGGSGSLDLMVTSRGWENIAAKLRELHGQVEQAIRGIGATQQGAAADAATNATMALLPWLADTEAAAQATAARICRQAGSFEYTRSNMPDPVPVPEVSFSQNPLTYLGQHAVEWLPGIQTGHERAGAAAQQAEVRAQELMTSYQSASNDNLVINQRFTMAPAVVADVLEPAPGGMGVGGASVGGSAAPSTPPYAGAALPGAAHLTSAAGGHVAPGQVANAAPAGTGPQIASGVHQPPAAATPSQSSGGYPGAESQPVSESTQVRPAAPAVFGSSPILAGAGSVSGASRPPGISGAAVGRGGSFGPRPSASAVLGETYSPPGSVGAQPADAGRAARGGGGWAGVPLGAPGSSGHDGEAEHRRPGYLIEEDTNAIVGELPRVAPPVIGED